MGIERLDRSEELALTRRLIERIVRECPRRQPTSEDERRAQHIMEEAFAEQGLEIDWRAFKFNDNLYANIALHYGMGTLGTLVSGVAPAAAFVLHTLAGVSYWAESTRRAYILRRLFRFKDSQNLLASLPAATKEPRLRVVFAAHADAAFTGLLFSPFFIKNFASEPPPGLGFLKRSMALANRSLFALAGVDLLRMFLGPLALPLRPLEAVMTLPSLIAFGLNMDVVLRDQIVPGANDDLSGVAALLILAHRLAEAKPDDVELVFAVTGCEEASLGGADALARDMPGIWDKDKTVVIGLDGLAGGELKYLLEGEVVRVDLPPWLEGAARRAAGTEPRFAEVQPFEVPVGGSDIAAFLARGWDGLCLACVNPAVGSPDHYHQPTDTPENLDYEKVLYSVDFAERLVEEIYRVRLG
jgi:hypothetical protein